MNHGFPASCRFFRIEPAGRASIFAEWALRPTRTKGIVVLNQDLGCEMETMLQRGASLAQILAVVSVLYSVPASDTNDSATESSATIPAPKH